MWGRKRVGITALAIALTVLLIPLGFISAQPQQKGPFLNQVIVETRATGEVAVGDVAVGALDAYFKSLSLNVYAGLPESYKQNLKLVPNAGTYYDIDINPVHDPDSPYLVTVEGKQYFNPFAIRKVRFALNYIVNRKYFADEILQGGGLPMFSAIKAVSPLNKYFEDVYRELGLTPEGNEQLGLQMIDEALTKASEELGGRLKKVPDPRAPAGYWWTFDGEPVTVKFYIRIEDERHEMGLYLADQIEKAGIKVDRIEANFRKCVWTVYLTDPKDYEWNLYTAGWGAGTYIAYASEESASTQFYAPWYGWMPGIQVEGWWQYENETIDELSKDIILGKVASRDEYWEKMKLLVKMGIQESVRVFTVQSIEYFPVNKRRTTQIGYDVVTGLWSYWPWRTADTQDHTWRIAVEAQQAQMFTSVFNPVEGFDDVYSMSIYRATVDPGVTGHPAEGVPIGVRVSWDLETDYEITPEGERVGKIPVPDTAVIYDSKEDKWVPVGPGKTAAAKVTFHLKLGNWHHGIPMDLNDIRYAVAFDYEWSSEDEPGDPFYRDYIESDIAPVLESIKGFEFIEPDTVVVYHDYIHVASDALTATYYVPWAALPWELMEAASYVVAYGGPVSGNPYDWEQTEGKEWLDLIAPSHVEDVKAMVEQLRMEGHVPGSVVGVTSLAAVERYNSDLKWIKQYGVAWISNGPFMLIEYDPQAMYMKLVAFRDPTYPFAKDYWYSQFIVVRERVESISAPATVTAGEPFDVTISITEIGEFPETYEKPAEEAYVLVRLKDPTGTSIFEGTASLVTPGTFKITVPGSVTEGKPEGSYTIEVTASKTAQAAGEVSTQEIIVTAPAPPPTTAAPTTPPPTTAAPTTPPPTTPAPTAAPAGPSMTLIIGIVVVIVIVVAALLLMRKKGGE